MQRKQRTTDPTTTTPATPSTTASAVDSKHTAIGPVAASDSSNAFARKIAKLKADERQDEQGLSALTKGSPGTVAG